MQYATYLTENIFGPLGMRHTLVRQDAGQPEIYSTVDDLDRLDAAVRNCTLISPQALMQAAGSGHTAISRWVVQVTGAQRGMAAGETFSLYDTTTIIVLANHGNGVQHLLGSIQTVVPVR